MEIWIKTVIKNLIKLIWISDKIQFILLLEIRNLIFKKSLCYNRTFLGYEVSFYSCTCFCKFSHFFIPFTGSPEYIELLNLKFLYYSGYLILRVFFLIFFEPLKFPIHDPDKSHICRFFIRFSARDIPVNRKNKVKFSFCGS